MVQAEDDEDANPSDEEGKAALARADSKEEIGGGAGEKTMFSHNSCVGMGCFRCYI